MTDPNMTDFYGRVARIQKDRANGYGFEAPGALGRSYYARPTSRRRFLVAPVLFLLICGFLLKGIIHYSVGAESYDNRVTALMVGKGVEPVGGWLMQAEPVTLFLSANITKGLTLSK